MPGMVVRSQQSSGDMCGLVPLEERKLRRMIDEKEGKRREQKGLLLGVEKSMERLF